MIPNRPNPYANLSLMIPSEPIQMANFGSGPQLPEMPGAPVLQQSDNPNPLQQVAPTAMGLYNKFFAKKQGGLGGGLSKMI